MTYNWIYRHGLTPLIDEMSYAKPRYRLKEYLRIVIPVFASTIEDLIFRKQFKSNRS